MKSKLLLAIAGFVLGIGLSAFPLTSEATTSLFPFAACDALCDDLYEACVADRGLNAGCGRERQNCYRFCRTGRL